MTCERTYLFDQINSFMLKSFTDKGILTTSNSGNMSSQSITAETTHMLVKALSPPPDNTSDAAKMAHLKRIENLFDILEPRRVIAAGQDRVNVVRLSSLERDLSTLMSEWARLARRWNVVVDDGCAADIDPEGQQAISDRDESRNSNDRRKLHNIPG